MFVGIADGGEVSVVVIIDMAGVGLGLGRVVIKEVVVWLV